MGDILNIANKGKEYIRQRLYPFTFQHLIYVLVFTALTTMISEYVFRFRLLKWIYIGTMIVIAATLYSEGEDEKAVGEIFKLATV